MTFLSILKIATYGYIYIYFLYIYVFIKVSLTYNLVKVSPEQHCGYNMVIFFIQLGFKNFSFYFSSLIHIIVNIICYVAKIIA